MEIERVRVYLMTFYIIEKNEEYHKERVPRWYYEFLLFCEEQGSKCPGKFDFDRNRLIELLERFEAGERVSDPTNPSRAMHDKDMDHHFP